MQSDGLYFTIRLNAARGFNLFCCLGNLHPLSLGRNTRVGNGQIVLIDRKFFNDYGVRMHVLAMFGRSEHKSHLSSFRHNKLFRYLPLQSL
ncbi:hypothetical protein SBA4_4800017 [Candidatus Sulfopaludibacter sp. SbA4]|nr:hypothetical protein SBA4_4800017 [Candidatus Sulfopaludibacter sp. SbA4]